MGHQYRFTLIHDSGTQEISEPEGWADIKITLERDKEYFGVFELFETPMTFYGRNQRFDGGYDFLENINTTYGPDAQVHIFIEIKPNIGDVFESFFTGLLDNSARKKMDSRKIQIPVIQNDFIAKFKSRSATAVNINSSKDLSGTDVLSPTSGNNQIQLIAQLIRQIYEGFLENTFTMIGFGNTSGDLAYHVIDTNKDITSEVNSKFTYPLQPSDTIPFEKFTMELAGDYIIQSEFVLRQQITFITHPGSTLDFMDLFIQVNGDAPIPYDAVDELNTFGSYNTHYSIDKTYSLRSGDTIRFYAKMKSGAGSFTSPVISGKDGIPHIPQFGFQGQWDPSLTLFPSDTPTTGFFSSAYWEISQDGNLQGVPVKKGYIINGKIGFEPPGQDPAKWNIWEKRPFEGEGGDDRSYIKVTANTTYIETTSKAFFIHDVAQKILERITEQSTVSPFYSEYLGGVHTLGSYVDDGCATHLMITQGLQLRQYTLSDKAFSISFNDWWQGVNPILNLGLCYDTVDGNLVIRVEEKAFFFEDDIFLRLDFANLIQEDYDLENIFNKIKIGYTTWKSEDISGIDDPQTTHQYSTVFKTVGKEIDIESGFIAASLAIEQTRRTTIQKSQDYKFDNNVFILSVKTAEATSPPDTFLPKLDEEFNSISNLLNSSSRYNLELTPLRNLLRWGNLLNGCLQRNLNTPYKFTYGEGNYAMVSDYSGSAPGICLAIIADSLSEGQDINLTGFAYGERIGHLFQPIVYTFTYPLSYSQYKLIKANRYKAIAISETNSRHITCFIKKIEYDINKSKAIFTLWKR